MIERSIKFTIGKKSFIAEFPNVGQIIDIESLKQALTSNKYGQMAVSGIQSQYFALDIVDAIAFYQICVPSVAQYYDISNYANISLDKATELINAYQKQIRPWYERVMKELRSVAEEDESKSTDNE